MINLRRILVPTDFSETSAAALRYASARPSLRRPPLLPPRCRPPGARRRGLSNRPPRNDGERRTRSPPPAPLRGGAKELLPDCAMRIGRPAEEIVQYAHEHAIDLIVMGTHGREGVMRAVLGSVAETVVRRAPCPVLTVHRPEPEFVMAEDLSGSARRDGVASCGASAAHHAARRRRSREHPRRAAGNIAR